MTVIDSSTRKDAASRARDGESPLARLRGAIAQEYVGKLPAVMAIDEFARFAGMTIRQVLHATKSGDLVVSICQGRRGIAPVDNLSFLLRERLVDLPAPRPSAGRGETRSLFVSEAAYERLWDEAVRTATTPTDALDRLLVTGGDPQPSRSR